MLILLERRGDLFDGNGCSGGELREIERGAQKRRNHSYTGIFVFSVSIFFLTRL